MERKRKEEEIMSYEAQVKQMREEENKLKIEKTFLSTIKDKMARTASQAHA